MKDFTKLDEKTQLLKSEGAGPFISKQLFRLSGGETIVWQSRQHRKGITERALHDVESFGRAFWSGFSNPGKLNWWIAVVFSVGSALFVAGSVLALIPNLAKSAGLDNTQVNGVFFLGSIPFTTAAFLQFWQATQATQCTYQDQNKPFRQTQFGRYLTSIAWLSAGLQFIGTLLFNVNTFNGMNSHLNWLQSDMNVWVPDFIGSILFLASGYLAFIEVAHAYWKCDGTSICWWIVFINLLGCIAFFVAAIFSFTPTGGASTFDINAALLFTLIGAFCFLLGSLLMLPEAGMEKAEEN